MADLDSHTILPCPSFDRPVKLLVAISPYYRGVSDGLLAGAKAQIEEAGAGCDVIEVPGALELPGAIALAGRLSNYDGYVALGCVIRGETTHYETVCNDSSRGLMLLGLQGYCIGNGILTVENMAQAEERADPAGQNKGGGAALAALHLVALARKWGGSKKGVGFRPASDEYQLAGGSNTV